MVISTTDSKENQSNNQQEKLGYVYRHIRLDTNMPFYIGISNVNVDLHTRAYYKHNRSDEWEDVVRNTEYRVDIILENLPLEKLCEKEKYFIKLYGRIDLGTGTLVNKTSGGQGGSSRIMSDKTKDILRQINLGKTHTEKTKKLIGDASKGNTYRLGKPHDKETRAKLKKSSTGNTHRRIKLMLHDEFGIASKVYDSLQDAILDGFSDGNINSCVNGHRKSHKGYRFVKIHERLIYGYLLTKKDIEEIKINSFKKNRNSITISLRIYDRSGYLEKNYNTLTEASVDGFNGKCIKQCIKKIYKQHKGYRYEKINDGLIHGYKLT